MRVAIFSDQMVYILRSDKHSKEKLNEINRKREKQHQIMMRYFTIPLPLFCFWAEDGENVQTAPKTHTHSHITKIACALCWCGVIDGFFVVDFHS